MELLAGAAAASATSAGLAAASFVPIAGAATSAASSLAAGAGLTSTVLGILQGVATATSVLGSLSAASSEQQALMMQAQEAELQAGQGGLDSANRQIRMKRELLQVLGANKVAAAAAGIDLQGGIAADDATAQKVAATREISIEREDDQMRRALIKARASGLRSRARDAGTAGLVRAGGQFAQFGMDVAERG
jgi:hypothetical protein